jgi:hypothetical protein
VTSAVKLLQTLLVLIAVFHLVAGLGSMFSIEFQQHALALYGARISSGEKDTYFIRIVGSFAFVLGYLAAVASRDPLKHQIVIIGFIESFLLRNVNRTCTHASCTRVSGFPPWSTISLQCSSPFR